MTAQVVDIAAPAERAPRHKWGERFVRLEDTPSGCPQSERTCAFCDLVKITVHPPHGLPWREWRPKGGPQMQFDSTPPCIAEAPA